MIWEIILWIVVIALFLIGLAGTILPTLPGNLLIFGGALIYGIFTEFEEITLWVLAALGVISIGAQVLDYLAEAYGAVGLRAKHPDEVVPVLKKGLSTPKTVIMEFMVEKEEKVYPMVPAGAPITDMLLV